MFDPKVFKDTNSLLSDWKTNRGAWKDTYSKWLGDFNKQTPEITSNVNQENSFLKWIQGGGLDKQLSSLRAEEGGADRLAQKNALDFAGNNAGYADLVTGGGGGRTSSADFARRLASGTRIADEFAQRAPARERADLGTSINLKLGTAGRANANLERLLSRDLQPHQLSDQELLEATGALGGIQKVRMGSASPVFYRQRGLGEQLMAPLDDIVSSYGIGSKPSPGGQVQVPVQQNQGGTPGPTGAMSAPQAQNWWNEFNGGNPYGYQAPAGYTPPPNYVQAPPPQTAPVDFSQFDGAAFGL